MGKKSWMETSFGIEYFSKPIAFNQLEIGTAREEFNYVSCATTLSVFRSRCKNKPTPNVKFNQHSSSKLRSKQFNWRNVSSMFDVWTKWGSENGKFNFTLIKFLTGKIRARWNDNRHVIKWFLEKKCWRVDNKFLHQGVGWEIASFLIYLFLDRCIWRSSEQESR